MQFQRLLRNEDQGRLCGRADRDVRSISCDSRTVDEGSIFFCLRGARLDGHAFASEAYRAGCRHFVGERPLGLPKDATVLLAENAERRMALLASDFYGSPASGMAVIGVTGTKGKTTTSHMIAHLLENSGVPCAYIGSSGAWVAGMRHPTENTTPQSHLLFRYIAAARDAKAKALVLEVSSQALSRGRLHGLPISLGVFTNLSWDHIGEGEHRDMEEYAAAKLSMFIEHGVQTAVLNASDPFSNVIEQTATPHHVLRYGNADGSHYRYRDLCPIRIGGGFGSHAVLLCKGRAHEVTLPLAGTHYIEDLLAAVAVAERLSGQSAGRLLGTVASFAVPGRSEVIPMENGATFVIDYAHNGASLRAALKGLRPYTHGRLICLFGAVGDRTQCRRRDMALAAFENADLLVITEDNSGEESTGAIIGEIYRSLPDRSHALCIPDRREAIVYLLSVATAGDVVLLAGKGDEEYQLSRSLRLPFSEKEILLEHARIRLEK